MRWQLGSTWQVGGPARLGQATRSLPGSIRVRQAESPCPKLPESINTAPLPHLAADEGISHFFSSNRIQAKTTMISHPKLPATTRQRS